MKWFRRKSECTEEKMRRETSERVEDVKKRAERVTGQLEDRRQVNHFSEALAALMKGHS